MTFPGFVYMVTAEKTCLTLVGDLHAAPMSSSFTSGFFPGETAIKAYWGLSRALLTAVHTATSISGES